MIYYGREQLQNMSYEDIVELYREFGLDLSEVPTKIQKVWGFDNVVYDVNVIAEKILEVQQQAHQEEEALRIAEQERFRKEKLKVDNLFEQILDKDTMERLNILFNRIISEPEFEGNLNLDSGEIDVPAKLSLYIGMDINWMDRYVVDTEKLLCNKVLLVNGDSSVCGIFDLMKETENGIRYFLTADKNDLQLTNHKNKNYYLCFFAKKAEKLLNIIYNGCVGYEDMPLVDLDFAVYKTEVNVSITEIETTDTVLCLDFGTSNTTAGCYLNENYVQEVSNNDKLNSNLVLNDVNFVRFLDPELPIDMLNNPSVTIPTVAYVVNCKKPENENSNVNVKLLFGYEAQKRIKELDYCSGASTFYGIKRWVNNYDDDEEIYDEDGNIAVIKKGLIISEYIKYVIKNAEHQFKCHFKNLHISSPVKLKNQFLNAFQELLSEYNIEKKFALDEGIAVLFDAIADKIEDKNVEICEEKKALVIDCGGGTTDLASCVYKITEDDISYILDIKTSFENGDTNFGGNNLTYRIMQFMKIVFANYYLGKKGTQDIDSLINVDDEEIFAEVDNRKGTETIYEKFENVYKEMEKVIPTKYKEYENTSKVEYYKVRNNFYFLWDLAEEMKKQFFKKTAILRNAFSHNNEINKDSDLHLMKLGKWNLAVKVDGKLVDKNVFPDVVFNIKEINKLIKGDIYNIIMVFLGELYHTGELNTYNLIKLTGQSCRINIFKEALKEYIPGKKLKIALASQSSLDLKVACLRGVIKYFRSKDKGDIAVRIHNEVPPLPFELVTRNFRNEEVVVLPLHSKSNEAFGSIGKPASAKQVQFELKDSAGKIIKNYIYGFEISRFKETSVMEILDQVDSRISEETVRELREGSINIYVYTDEFSWGFFAFAVCKRNETFYMEEKKYFAFQSNLGAVTFFDGYK